MSLRKNNHFTCALRTIEQQQSKVIGLSVFYFLRVELNNPHVDSKIETTIPLQSTTPEDKVFSDDPTTQTSYEVMTYPGILKIP